MKTIREQVISALATELANIRIANGYHTDIGQNIVRGRYDLWPAELPAIVLIADTESVVRRDSHVELSIPVNLEAFVHFGTHNSAIESEKVLGDLLVNMLSTRLMVAFTNGSREPQLGRTLTGATSGATAILESITLSSGAWASGTAAGTFSVRMPHGDFESEILKNEGNETIAQTDGTITLMPRLSDLVNDIEYQNGGIDILPDPGENIVKTVATFTVHYVTLTGNPYQQS